MFNSTTHKDRLLQHFLDQFEADGSGYLYRRSGRGPGSRVTAGERDGFAEAYLRAIMRLIWIASGLMVTAILLAIVILDSIPEGLAWPLLALFLTGFLPVHIWLWRAPERALSGRRHEGADRSSAEAGRATLRKTSWGELVGGGLILVFLIYDQSTKRDLFAGWNLLLLLAAVVMASLIAFRAWRKWRDG